ncbi:transglycosylase SLT domain-containing protein [Phytomonospora sp. NPDC050363]|uniref:transglycosylase SLT domain-containing protein n=1 Tax=Phytomonospora sp. NPDC050363 TaxID=3155642 RepID=UPI0033F186EC
MGVRLGLRVAGPAALAALAALALAGCGLPSAGPHETPSSAKVTDDHSWNPQPIGGDYDPADYAAEVREHAAEADVNPVLLMAILYNESYKPHDPEAERAWQLLDPDASFGIANMHKAAFDDTKRGRDFEGRQWEELPDDRELAVQAAAWYLHDLAGQLPEDAAGEYSGDQLLAAGYNAGPGSMAAYAGGAEPSASVAAYMAKIEANWEKSEKAIEG